MTKKICIITGANSGIGKQAAVQIAVKGYHVILGCRSRERGEDALKELRALKPEISIELMIIDLSSRKSVLRFAEEFNKKYDHLDVIIHNAAVFNITQKTRMVTVDGIETVWATNHLGSVLLTELLLEKLKMSDNSRILTISSKGLLAKPFMRIDLNDPEFKSKKFNITNAYYQSKIAQVMYTYWLADRLNNTNITVNCIRVTAVKVDISRHPGLSNLMKWIYTQKAKKSIEPEVMAKSYTYLATSPDFMRITGKYFDENCSQVDSSKYSKNLKNIDDVMQLTKSYIPEMRNI